MTLWDLFDMLGGVPDPFECWRFYLCLLLSFGIAVVIYWLVPNLKIALGFSAGVVLYGIVGGVAWQLRA